jgi:hypothetical protein
LTKDARLINCFAELDQEAQEYIVYKRMGLSTIPYYDFPSGTALGIYKVPNEPIVITIVAGPINGLATVYYNGITILGTVDATGGPYIFINTGTPGLGINANNLGFMNANQGYTIAWTRHFPPLSPPVLGLARITDPNFPVNRVPGIVSLDGLVYVMDITGTIWGSVADNVVLWDPLNSIEADSESDQAIYLAKQLNIIIAFKSFSTQMFYDAGNPAPGSPLLPVPDAQLPYGCVHSGTVQSIDNMLIWATSNQTISPQIAILQNLTPTIVSSPAVERILTGILWQNTYTDIRSWSFKHSGHRFYGLTIIQLNITLVYDIDQQLWYIWTDSNENYWPITTLSYQDPDDTVTPPTQGLILAQHISNGNVYILDEDTVYPSDYGTLPPVDIYTNSTSFGTVRRKYLKGMYIRADQTPYSNLQVRYSDNDFQTWSNFRTIDLSKIKPRMMDCGTFTKRAYHFRHQCNTSFRIMSSDLAMDIGTL